MVPYIDNMNNLANFLLFKLLFPLFVIKWVNFLFVSGLILLAEIMNIGVFTMCVFVLL